MEPSTTYRTQIEPLVGGFGKFPENFYLIRVEEDKFASNNATAPDGSSLDGLACFPTLEDVEVYTCSEKGIGGVGVPTTWDEARDLAKCKPQLNSLLLFRKDKIVDFHYVQ
jgi:hypothetical protein